jgi:hypothetical protein
MSYELVDAIGVQSIAAMIKLSNLQKISISKYASGKTAIPVYEDNDSKTNDRIVKAFTDWATNILHGNPYNDTVYEVLLYNEPLQEEPDEADEKEKEKVKVKRGYSRANKMRFCIQLYRPGTAPGVEKVIEKVEACKQINEGLKPEQISDIVKTMLMENEVMRRLTLVEIELRGVHERIDEVIDEIEELSEDLEEINGAGVNGTHVDNERHYFDKMIDLLNVKAAGDTKLAGTETENEPSVVKANINKAIAILYKHDKKIDQHLLKLANLAETKPELFTQVIAQLEKM